MPKVKIPSSIAKSKEYKDLFNSKSTLETLATHLSKEATKAKISYSEMYQAFDSVPLKEEEPYNDILKKGWGEDLPESLKFDSAFSPEEKKKRAALTKKAYLTYSMSIFGRQAVSFEVTNMVSSKKITEAEGKELSFSRDITSMFLRPLTGEDVHKENEKSINYLLLRDLDKSQYNSEQLNIIKNERRAELINKTLKSIIDTDFSKFRKMSDEELVENWSEYQNACYVLATVKKELSGSAGYKNPGINQEYIDKCLEMEQTYNMEYMLYANRIQLIANPHYQELDIDHFTKIPSEDFVEFDSYDDRIQDNPEMAKFLLTASGVRQAENAICEEKAQQIFSNKYGETEASDLAFYDKNGIEIGNDELISKFNSDGVFYVAHRLHPESVTAFEFDWNSREISENQKLTDSKAVKEIQNKLEKNLPKYREEKEKAKAKRELQYFEKNVNFDNLYKLSTSLGYEVSSLTRSVLATKDPEKYKKMTIAKLQEILAPEKPETSGDDFYEFFSIAPKDRLSKEEIDKRREFSSQSIEKVVNARYKALEARELPRGLHNAIAKMTNYRQFSSFMFKPGKENLQSNIDIAKKYFGLDENGNSLNIDPEVLKTAKQQLVENRIKEYKALHDSLWGKKYTDKDVMDNIEAIQEVGVGMGMEWKSFKKLAEKDGVDFSGIEGLNRLHEESYLINNSLAVKADYICTSHYQFGNLDKLASEEGFMLSVAHPDKAIQRTAGRAFDIQSFTTTSLGSSAILSLGDNAQVEFVYNAEGEPVDPSDGEIGKALASGQDLYVFEKGKKYPTLFEASDINLHETGLPMETHTKDLTPEMKTQARIMRVNYELDKIQADSIGKLNPQHFITVSTRYQMTKFNLAELAAGMNGLEGEKREAQYKALREAMAEYICMETLIKTALEMSLSPKTMIEMTSDENLKKYTNDMGANSAIDFLIEDMLKEDPSGSNFYQMDPKKILSNFSKELSNSKKIEQADRNKLIDASLKVFANQKQVTKISNKAKTPEFWGMNHDILNKTLSKTSLKSLTIDRNSLQTIAFGKMLNDGFSVDEIFSDTPEMATMRKEASFFAAKAVVSNDKETIFNTLNTARDKFNNYLGKNIATLQTFKAAELLTVKNATFVSTLPFAKDFFQETTTIMGYFDKEQQAKMKDSKFEESMAKIDAYSNITSQISAGAIGATDSYKKKDDFKSLGDIAGSSFGKVLDEAINAACITYYKNKPENRGKDVSTFVNEDFLLNRAMLSMKLQSNPEIGKIKQRYDSDEIFAEKFIGSLMDDTLVNNLNLQVQGFKKDDNGMIEPQFTMDVNKAIKMVDYKNLAYGKDYIQKKMQQRSAIMDPRAKAQEMLHQNEGKDFNQMLF